MNNVASSNSLPTPESSFCPPSGFARDFVGRTRSGDQREFLLVLGSKEGLERSELDQESKFGQTRNFFNGPGSSADLPDFYVKIQSKFGDLQSFS
jgi:hypothetical protein